MSIPVTPLPPLLESLEKITSPNGHLYDATSAADALKSDDTAVAAQTAIDGLSPYLYKHANLMVPHTYSPEELMGITRRLSALNIEDRPTFNDTESLITDQLRSLLRTGGISDKDKRRVRGIIERADASDDVRDGMQFNMLNDMAEIASEPLKEWFGGSEERRDYVITVVDPQKGGSRENGTKRPNMEHVIEFVALDEAKNIAGERQRKATALNIAAVLANSGIIDAFLEENAEQIKAATDAGIQLRDTFVDEVRNRERSKQRHPGNPIPESVTMRSPLELLNSLNELQRARIENGEGGEGLRKGYEQDPEAVLRLQYSIGRHVGNLIAAISEHNQA